MNVKEAILNRRSIRKFSDKKLSFEEIKNIINISTHSPTAMKNEPWLFLVIQGKEKLKEISDDIKIKILSTIDSNEYMKKYENWFKDENYNIFYDAENIVIVYGDKNKHWFMQDCCCLSQNIILESFERGIGTCWIGFADFIINDDEFKNKFDIPENYDSVSCLIMGYIDEKENLKPSTRKEAKIISVK